MKRNINVKLIVILSIICTLVLAGLVLYFRTDFFRTKRSAFFRYFNYTTDVLEVLKAEDLKDYKKMKQDNPYTRNSNVKIQSSSNIADSRILDNLKLTLSEKVDNKNEKASMDIKISNGNRQLTSISGIREKDIYGAFCSDVSNGYIGIKNEDLKRIATDMGINNVMLIPNEVSNMNFDNILDISKLEKKHINECLNIIKNDVPTTAYNKEGKKKIKINGTSYATTAYSLGLNSTDNANLQADLLEKLSTDSILMDFLASRGKLIGLNEEYTTINSLNDVMKKRIEWLRKNPGEAGDLTITVYEYKQKNIRTEIKNGDNVIQIDHLKENDIETSSIKLNKSIYKIQHAKNNYKYIYENNDEIDNKFEVDYKIEGNPHDGKIKNKMEIVITEGIKNITFVYDDDVNFTNDIGEIANFGNDKIAILNDYNDNEIKEFTKTLKQRINTVYVSKGASIGINLDPIFEL